MHPFAKIIDKKFLGEEFLNEEFLKEKMFFSSGRDVFLYVASLFKEKKTLFMPRYFCQNIFFIKEIFNVKFYFDMPNDDEPIFEEIPQEGDIVLAVNYFGANMKKIKFWNNFKAKNEKVLLMQDFTFAPFSKKIKDTNADFIFASLRKVLFLPDGGYLIVKDKNFYKDFFAKSSIMPEFASNALSGALLNEIDFKAGFRLLENAEMLLNNKRKINRISHYSFEILKRVKIKKYLKFLLNNKNIFIKNLTQEIKISNKKSRSLNVEIKILNQEIKILNDNQKETESFFPILIFEDENKRNLFYKKYSDKNFYPIIYWYAKENNFSQKEKSFAKKTLCVIP